MKIIEHPKEGILAKLKASSEDIPDQITLVWRRSSSKHIS